VCYADTAESCQPAAAADAADAADNDDDKVDSSTLRGGMSGSQRELVDIMQQVKTKHLTVDEAEEFFYDWKMRHERGFTRSFRQKQVSRLPVSRPRVVLHSFSHKHV